jgi:hypothetical protein
VDQPSRSTAPPQHKESIFHSSQQTKNQEGHSDGRRDGRKTTQNMAPPSPPGPLVQYLNAISHVEPFVTILHLIVFVPFLILATPLGLVGIFLYAAFRLYVAYIVSPITPAPHLAVVVTGCDSGFGRELALSAADAGFTVFAGCLTPQTSWPGPTSPRLIPLLMDVTNDGQVQEAVRSVEQWLAANDDSQQPPRRRLHALVNNAGVGGIGLVDWMDVKFYELCINGACVCFFRGLVFRPMTTTSDRPVPLICLFHVLRMVPTSTPDTRTLHKH